MGRLNSSEEHARILSWAENIKSFRFSPVPPSSLDLLRQSSYETLLRYFSLAALSCSTTASNETVQRASRQVFRIRRDLELGISNAVRENAQYNEKQLLKKSNGSFYGYSKKQGVSVRMPLSSCVPTQYCSSRCYAHDALDATPSAVVRGAINGLIAELYELGSGREQDQIIVLLQIHTKRAIKRAISELQNLPPGFLRRPRIRFAHVGEIAAFPKFANALARQVHDISDGAVVCVAYTRHPNAFRFDPELWIVNFTLDSASEERREWIPDNARTVYSAFDGKTSNSADVNYLEHHRWIHFKPEGYGFICPATAPGTKNRTCDACKCCRCFTAPKEKTFMSRGQQAGGPLK
jgi:hypothetical protein